MRKRFFTNHSQSTLRSNTLCSNTFRSEKGAIHILGPMFLMLSVYSTYLMFEEHFRAERLSNYVEYQKKQIDSLELRMQILELRRN